MKGRLLVVLFYLLTCFISPLVAQESEPADEMDQQPPTSVESPLTEPEEAEPFYLDESQSPGQPKFVGEFVNMLLTLAFVIVLILIMAWVLKRLLNQRMLSANKGAHIQIVERRGLTPKTALYLVEVHGRRLVIGESPAGLHSVADLGVEFPPAPSKSFDEVYDKTKGKEE